MGTSVRKTSAKIKKMLKETIELNPNVGCKEVVPQVATETLKSKKTRGYFGDKDFAVLAGGGFACFKRVKEVGFDNFINEYEIESNKITAIEVQKIIENILDSIEDENGEIASTMLLAAFQSAMTKMLMDKLSEPKEFLNLFCEIFISMVIREDASEELSVAFKNTEDEVLESNIKEFATEYVKDNLSGLIDECANGQIQIDELIQRLQEKLKES